MTTVIETCAYENVKQQDKQTAEAFEFWKEVTGGANFEKFKEDFAGVYGSAGEFLQDYFEWGMPIEEVLGIYDSFDDLWAYEYACDPKIHAEKLLSGLGVIVFYFN